MIGSVLISHRTNEYGERFSLPIRSIDRKGGARALAALNQSNDICWMIRRDGLWLTPQIGSWSEDRADALRVREGTAAYLAKCLNADMVRDSKSLANVTSKGRSRMMKHMMLVGWLMMLMGCTEVPTEVPAEVPEKAIMGVVRAASTPLAVLDRPAWLSTIPQSSNNDCHAGDGGDGSAFRRFRSPVPTKRSQIPEDSDHLGGERRSIGALGSGYGFEV